MRSVQVVGAIVTALLFAGPGAAETATRSITDVAAIVHDSGAGRVLFRADLTTDEENAVVRRALVRVPLGSLDVTRRMTLRVHPVTTAWARGQVSWTTGWARPGGDFEDLLHGRAEIAAGDGGGEAIFDITILAKEVIEHGADNYGFILTMDPDEGIGLPASDLEGLGALSGATIQLEWRRRPPSPHRG